MRKTILILLFFTLNMSAQDSLKSNFNETLSKSISLKLTTYKDIETLFFKYKKDSTLMKRFENESCVELRCKQPPLLDLNTKLHNYHMNLGN